MRAAAYGAAGLIVLLGIGDSVYVASALPHSLRGAESGLERARVALGRAEWRAADAALNESLKKARRAVAFTDRPAFAVASALPEISRDAEAVEALAKSAELTSRAGRAGIRALSLMNSDTQGLAPSLYKGGRLQFDTVARGRPPLAAAERLATDAFHVLTQSPDPHLPLLQRAVATATSEVHAAAISVNRARVLMDNLPALLGRDGPRRYFLAFQALGEARGTGGLIGLYGVLRADSGKLSLEQVAPIRRLIPTPQIEGPRWFEENYGPQSSLRQIQQVNLSPNFPVVAEMLLRMYEAKSHTSLDGVLAMDPISLADMMRGVGPLRSRGLDVDVGPENAPDVLLRDSYVKFKTEEQQESYLAGLVRAFWERVNTGRMDEEAFAQGLVETARTTHLKAYSRDPKQQSAFASLGVDGGISSAGPSIQLVFHNNYGGNKIDYYLRRHVHTAVALDRRGLARVVTAIRLENDAPIEPPGSLGGRRSKTRSPGSNTMQLNVLMPQGARPLHWSVDGQKRDTYVYSDDGYPVAWDSLEIPPQAAVTAELVYEAPARYSDNRYRLTLIPQTTVRPDSFSLTLVPPEGFLAKNLHDADARWTSLLEVPGALDQKRSVEVALRAT